MDARVSSHRQISPHIATTSPDRRSSVSPGRPISVPLVSGILVRLWLLTKWAYQGSAELDYVCVLSRGLMRRGHEEVQCLRHGSRRDLTHIIAELVVCAVKCEDQRASDLVRR